MTGDWVTWLLGPAIIGSLFVIYGLAWAGSRVVLWFLSQEDRRGVSK